MSHFDRSLRSQFFLTGPRPCPYLKGKRERKLFTNLSGPQAAALHDELAAHGFRRSQNIAYRPACSGCDACVSTRVRVRDFAPSRSQKRILKRNADLIRRADDAWATQEQYRLFARYLDSRHPDGGMTDMDMFDFAAMVEDTPVRTKLVEYRKVDADEPDGRLVAVCITDLVADGLSLVYSFFDPDEDRRSLGQFIILDHIAIAEETGLPFVYLGYWVVGSPKMDYKIKFQPAEALTDRGWRPCPDPNAKED
ncbi:MAG: arginyltransferase [Rhodobacteraceae bacterium]|nr:arginyltransferase [Paracoccaceae bacterium]